MKRGIDNNRNKIFPYSMQISKNVQKLIKSLETKKYRMLHQLFVAEGPKVVAELAPAFKLHTLVATEEWVQQSNGQSIIHTYNPNLYIVDEQQLTKTSLLQHPQQVMALFEIPERKEPQIDSNDLTLMLDGVQDPGNMGTIIRIADWFGIHNIICSNASADAYNPKVVQSTMGSLSRVNVAYADLEPLLAPLCGKVPIYGTLLDGSNIYDQPLSASGIIIMGNEGKGISPAIRKYIDAPLLIPSYNKDSAESLNVAIATAITCAEFRRREAIQVPPTGISS